MKDLPLVFCGMTNIADFVVGCVMLVLFVVTAGIHIPRRREWGQFRMAVRLVGLACLLLAVNYIVPVLFRTGTVDATEVYLKSLVTVDGAMFQALLFSMTAVVLVLPDSIRWPLVARHVSLTGGVTLATLGAFALFPEFRALCVVVASICYGVYVICLTIYFLRSFTLAVSYLETLYDDDMLPRLRWVRVFFYGALFVGLMALVTSISPNSVINYLFDASVTVYYCYAVVRLMNYVVTSAFVVKVPMGDGDIAELVETSDVQQEPEDVLPKYDYFSVEKALDEWIAARGYAQGDMTVDEIIESLGVRRQDFTAYFRNVLGTRFRTWRRSIRIAAAVRLVDENPTLPISEIIDSVGYSDRSNFHKHFQSAVGVSFKDYRLGVRAPEVDSTSAANADEVKE